MRIIVCICAAVLLLSGCSLSIKSEPSESKGLQSQLVNNPQYFKDLDVYLMHVAPIDRFEELAKEGCHAEAGMVGVYGNIDDNPLMQRFKGINDRYNRYWQQYGEGLKSPRLSRSLTEAQLKLCPRYTMK